MARSVRRRTWPWVVLFSAIALVVLFYVGGGWYFAGQVYQDALKVNPYDPAALQRGTVTAIDSTREPPTVTILPEESVRMRPSSTPASWAWPSASRSSWWARRPGAPTAARPARSSTSWGTRRNRATATD